jgi:uncharacterized protein (DUF433 family)
MAWYHEFIATDPGVQGGYPVVRGTRTPVRTIIVLYRQSDTNDLATIRDAFPHLTTEQVEAALAYYHDHPDIVDEDIQRQNAALGEFLART